VGLIQHKREAYWFYRFLSLGYDRWVNPLFWTPEMRAQALAAARLDAEDLTVVDVGAGTGFTTQGIVARVHPRNVTMLDQSPHQLQRSRAKPELAECTKVLGDAESLPFATDSFDRYVSAGSIEYWPDPQRGVAEAYRVTKPNGTALLIGPVRPANRVARALASAWMLFPPAEEYERWFRTAGFEDVTTTALAPHWYANRHVPYALAVSGTKPRPGPSPATHLPKLQDPPAGPLRFAARFVLGSAAGAAFVPIAAVLSLKSRRGRRR
jgi:MPBQ/MSBQ methyltransferase